MNLASIIAVAIPTLAILFGILLNRQDATAIRSEMKAEIGQLRGEMGQLRTELKSDHGQLRSDLLQLRDSIHRDMVGLHERLATVEAKQANG